MILLEYDRLDMSTKLIVKLRIKSISLIIPIYVLSLNESQMFT